MVLPVVYASYLVFQLWSHTHLYQDNTVPSTKLPASVSMRSVTSRVRQKSNQFRERERRIFHNSKQSLAIPPTPMLNAEKAKTFDTPEMEPEYEELEPVNQIPNDVYASSGRKACLVSPFGTTSQITLSSDFGVLGKTQQDDQGETTVRLVRHAERGRTTSSGESSCAESFDDARRRHGAGSSTSGRESPVTEVISAYVSERGEVLRRNAGSPMVRQGTPMLTNSERFGSSGRMGSNHTQDDGSTLLDARNPVATHREPELSWTLTMLLLLTVTVVRLFIDLQSESHVLSS